MSRFLFSGCMIVLWSLANAQSRNAHWLIGENIWLHFDETGPTVQSSGAGPMIWSAMSDPSGALLFAANGDQISTSTLGPMDGGAGPWCLSGVQHHALIAPRPGSPLLYDIVFRTGTSESTWPYAKHVVVDMSANGGSGAVVSGSLVAFGDTLTLRMAACAADEEDYWFMFHQWDSDAFLAYRLSSSGLDTVPVVSHAGPVLTRFPNGSFTSKNGNGQMSFSYDGDRLAFTTIASLQDTENVYVELFEFDDATGEVSHFMSFPGFWKGLGLEFSLDGSKLYINDGDSLTWSLYQFDLSSNDPATILSTKIAVAQAPYTQGNVGRFSTLALGMDGRIYVGRDFMSTRIGRINSPDLAGTLCDVDMNYLEAAPNTPASWFPCMIKRYHDSEFETGAGETPDTLGDLSLWPTIVTDGRLWISAPAEPRPETVEIFDPMGRSVRVVPLRSNTAQMIQLGDLPPGAYTLRSLHRSGASGIARFVVH